MFRCSLKNTNLGLTAMTKSRVGPRPTPSETGVMKFVFSQYSAVVPEHENCDYSTLPVRKAKPARIASLFFSVSGL